MSSNNQQQQTAWAAGHSRLDPQSEGEFLEMERALGHLSMKRRHRILGVFSAHKDNAQTSLHDLIPTQDFTGVTLVGLVSTLLGQQGLHAQCLWYKSKAFDWYWAVIGNVEKIERREDPRFRGGATCIWLTTPIAEYAMTVPHAEYTHQWDQVIATMQVPRIDLWPKEGFRPDWWPGEYCGAWPFQQREEEPPRIMSREDELQRLTEQLSVQDNTSRTSWSRLGPAGDQGFPGLPRHHLNQLLAWDLAYDAGLKVTRDRLDKSQEGPSDEEAESVVPQKGKKRKGVYHLGGPARAKR